MRGAAGARTINNPAKKFLYLLAAIVVVAVVFNLGQRLRLASLTSQLRRPALISQGSLRGSTYLVMARPLVAPGGAPRSTGLLPVVAAADPTADDSDSSSEMDDLLSSDSPAATFQQVYLLLKDQFVNHIDNDAPLAHGAAAAMLASLDEPNSRFVDAPEREALDQQGGGLFQGIGAAFTVRKFTDSSGLVQRQITIIDALPGSPAEKAGLRTGDVVAGVDGHWVIGYDPFAAQAKLFKKLSKDDFDLEKAVDATEKRITEGYSLSKAQTLLDTTSKYPLRLTIQRPRSPKTIEMTIDVSAPTQVKDVEARKLADGNGYVVFNAFTDSTAADFANALNGLGDIKGLVIDLRDCSGGMLDPAIQIAKAMAPGASLGEIDVRSGEGTATAAFPTKLRDLDAAGASALQISYRGPISVLVNKGTANTAELLAAFLHDKLGAQVVGADTFGDALAQTLFPLSDGSAFTLTTGILKTDRDRSFNESGLEPQYVLADAGHAGDGDGDAAMVKAAALLASVPTPSNASESPLGPPRNAEIAARAKKEASL